MERLVVTPRRVAPGRVAQGTASPQSAAFFDVDKTLIPGSSLFLLARGAYERDLLRVRDMLGFGWEQLLFRLRGESKKGVDTSRDATLRFVAGRSQRELVAWGAELVEERILPLVYADIVKVIESHKKRGDLTFLVTAAPIELASTLADALEMTAAIGTESELDEEGNYTGRLLGGIVHGAYKAEAVKAMAAERGLDLAECSAYSDSMNDLPLLELVGNPHVVNPEHELRRIARARGWPVHEMRVRRRALLIGIPAGVGGLTLFATGLAVGAWLQRRREARRRGPVERTARRFHI